MITTFLLDSIGIETIVTVALGIFLIIAVILCFVIRSLSINKGKILKGLHTVAVYFDGNTYTTYNLKGDGKECYDHPSTYAYGYICGYYIWRN